MNFAHAAAELVQKHSGLGIVASHGEEMADVQVIDLTGVEDVIPKAECIAKLARRAVIVGFEKDRVEEMVDAFASPILKEDVVEYEVEGKKHVAAFIKLGEMPSEQG